MSETRSAGQRLRDLLAGSAPVDVVECYSALTGRVVESYGLPAVYIGGHAMGNIHHAVPDHGLVTTTEMVEAARRITAAVDLPLIVDGDQGGETPLNVRRFVRDLEQAGAAGVHLEDTVNPKHLLGSNSLAPVHEFRQRLRAAVDARRDEAFVIIARTDALYNGDPVEVAVERGLAAAEEGADAYMCLQMSPEQMATVAAAVPIPLVDINQKPEVARANGLRVNIHTGFALPFAVRAQRDLVEQVVQNGHLDLTRDVEQRRYTAELVGDAAWNELGQTWAGREEPAGASR
jgi:methylisocitrate lyase